MQRMQRWPLLDWREESLVKENTFGQIVAEIQKDWKCFHWGGRIFKWFTKALIWISLWWCHFWIWLETIWLRSIRQFLGWVLNSYVAFIFGCTDCNSCHYFRFSGDLCCCNLCHIDRPFFSCIDLLLEPYDEPDSSFANNIGHRMLCGLLSTYSICLPYRRITFKEENTMHYQERLTKS